MIHLRSMRQLQQEISSHMDSQTGAVSAQQLMLGLRNDLQPSNAAMLLRYQIPIGCRAFQDLDVKHPRMMAEPSHLKRERPTPEATTREGTLWSSRCLRLLHQGA